MILDLPGDAVARTRLRGAAEFRDALRYRRFARPQIEIVRKLDRPLVLVCTVTLPVSPADARRCAWSASFEARWARFGTRRDSFRWLEARAPVSFVPHTSTASFTLRIDIPQTLPYPQSTWTILVQSDEPRSQPIEFLLPEDLVFTEDYPAG